MKSSEENDWRTAEKKEAHCPKCTEATHVRRSGRDQSSELDRDRGVKDEGKRDEMDVRVRGVIASGLRGEQGFERRVG